ncbi:hypothetical protein [Caulobacter soli]|uniref:hypothetical protein n=1 Tax=Caulobacter soli TaxID=2708539 RepID=UPI0013ECAC39|nr:hypothetical protein [Caulobacter soli]
MQISATTPNPAATTAALAPNDAPEAAAPQPAVQDAASPAPAPAVTVTLSPEARAAQKALTAMPMADAVKQLTPGAQGSGTLAQAKSLLLKLADGSGVPQDEQIKAYVDLQKLVFTDPDRAWFTQSTPEDRKAYAAIMDGGQTSLAIRKAADDFNAWGMSQDLHSNVPRKNLAHLNAMSPLQQQMVFAGTVSMDGTVNNGATSLDEWKAQMQVDIVNVDKMIAMDEAEKKAGKSGKKTAETKVAEDGTTASNDDSPEAQALAALTSPNQGDGVATAALKMLQKAAQARAEAKDRVEKDRKDAEARVDTSPRPVLEPYVIGDKVDKSV